MRSNHAAGAGAISLLLISSFLWFEFALADPCPKTQAKNELCPKAPATKLCADQFTEEDCFYTSQVRVFADNFSTQASTGDNEAVVVMKYGEPWHTDCYWWYYCAWEPEAVTTCFRGDPYDYYVLGYYETKECAKP